MRPMQTAMAPPPEVDAGALNSGRRALSRWLPSAADIFFCSLVCMLAVGRGAEILLDDGDAGWHIRNGQHILSTWSIPYRDYFSWTRAGRPWYAWEWLFDALEGVLHHLGGLNAVVALAAILIALSYRLLFQRALQRSGQHWFLAGGLTLLAVGAGSQHFLARPDEVTLLLTVIWLQWLEEVNEGRRRFWRFPLVMLLWTNLHGGFIVGLALVLVYALANGWEGWWAKGGLDPAQSRHLARVLGGCFALCSAVTLVNPYGWRLHLHIVHYLSDGFLLNTIQEFASPNFHVMAGRCFEILLLAGGWILIRHSRAVRMVDLLLVAMALHLGLMAVRNLGLASVLVIFVVCGVLGRAEAEASSPAESRPPGRFNLRALSRRLARVEMLPRWHWLPLLLLAVGGWMIVHQGKLGGRVYLDAHFSRQVSPGEPGYGFPVRAAGVLQGLGTPPHLLTTDSWAGYLMYRLYPDFHPFFDGRSDFYGDRFLKQYLKVVSAHPGWQEVLDKEQVEWVLLPPDYPLTAVLLGSPGWRLVYQDHDSLLFRRAGGGRVKTTAAAGGFAESVGKE